MYDYSVLLSVTIIGQLSLLMLIEELSFCGFEILSANTDGITAKVPIAKEEKFNSICDNWEKDTNFELEYTEYFTYFRLSISDYCATTKGNPKRKGFFKKHSLFSKNDAMIVRKAVIAYFSEDIIPESTIKSKYNTIYDFCYSFKTTKHFKLLMVDNNGRTELQRVNRWYVSTNKNREIYKERISKEEGAKVEIGQQISMDNSCGAMIVNNLLQGQMVKDIDYNHYIAKAMDIILQIEILDHVAKVKSLGLIPIPKLSKKNPRGAKLDTIIYDWVERGTYSKYPGVGIYTGSEAGIIAIDIDFPEILKENHPDVLAMMDDTLTIFHGCTLSQAQLLEHRCTFVYKCSNPYLKSSTGAFTKKYGFEICFGKKPVVLIGIHTDKSGAHKEIYQYDGDLIDIPDNLLAWLLENGPKKGIPRKKSKDGTESMDFKDGEEKAPPKGEKETIQKGVVYSPDEEEIDNVVFVLSELMPDFDYDFLEGKDGRLKWQGECPFNDEHSNESQKTDFHIYFDEHGQINAYCFHSTCRQSIAELKLNLALKLFEHIQLKQRDEKLAAIEIQKQIFENEESIRIKELLYSDFKILILESPTGSGKTTESAYYFVNCVSKAIPVCYIAANRTDQEQFVGILKEITGKELSDLFTQVLKGGNYLDEELDKTGAPRISKATIGLVAHHTYLQRKGISLFFYPFFQWVMANKPVILIDEGDQFCDSLTSIIMLQDRYVKRQQLGANQAEYWRINQCPSCYKAASQTLSI
jgi:hypothetical protein